MGEMRMHYDVQETGLRIKKERQKREYTQAVLAEMLGLHTKTYQRIESGKLGIGIDLALALSNEFGISLDYIYKGSESEAEQIRVFERLVKNKNTREVQFVINLIEIVFNFMQMEYPVE